MLFSSLGDIKLLDIFEAEYIGDISPVSASE
jgi:hypothetical protein